MKKVLSAILMVAALLLCFSGCSDGTEPVSGPVRVGALRGPTAMGMAKLMTDGQENYEFTLGADAAALVAPLTKGELDIAAIPANLAATLYNNTDGAVKLVAINTLNVLYIVERGDTIRSVSDLAGRTLYATGEAAVPEYVLRYVLEQNGLTGDKAPLIRWCSDTTEVLARLEAEEHAAAMLPQPFVSAAQMKVEGLRRALDLGSEWKKLSPDAEIITGVLAVRTEFAEKHPDELAAFLEEYKASVSFVTQNTDAAAELIGELEIVKAPIAKKALPSCGISYIDGSDMESKVGGFLRILYESDAKSVGGKLPDSGFYYERP